MQTVGQEIGTIETRLRQIGAKLDRLTAQANETGAETASELLNHIGHAKEHCSLVRVQLKAFRDANGQKWDSFRPGVETAWLALADALAVVERRPELRSRSRSSPQ